MECIGESAGDRDTDGLSDREQGLISRRTGSEWRAYSTKGAGLMASL